MDNNLVKFAKKFRSAIEQYINEEKPHNDLLRHFPVGNCTLACSLLQRFLYENGVETRCVCGRYDHDDIVDSHEWLETKDKIIIDITGDQYKHRPDNLKYNKSVYVGPKDCFHNLFSITDEDPYIGSIPNNSEFQLEKNDRDYDRIIKRIDKSTD